MNKLLDEQVAEYQALSLARRPRSNQRKDEPGVPDASANPEGPCRSPCGRDLCALTGRTRGLAVPLPWTWAVWRDLVRHGSGHHSYAGSTQGMEPMLLREELLSLMKAVLPFTLYGAGIGAMLGYCDELGNCRGG